MVTFRIPGLLAALLVAGLLALVGATPAVAAPSVKPAEATGTAARPAAAAPAPTGRTTALRFGVSVPGGPTASAELDASATAAGERPSVVLSYADFTTAPPLAGLDAVRARGADPVVTWEPWTWGSADRTRFSMSSIAAGAHDAYLRTWADSLRRWGGTVYLRFAHEQNGDWYPWSVGGGTTAADYTAAWRHVAQLFDQAGAGNVQFVWNPNVSYPGSSPMAATWPGADVVDLVGLDGYNWGTSQSWSSWQSPQTVFASSLAELRALAPGKPVVIGEVASAEAGGDKAAWIRDLVTWLDAQRDVAAVVWFDHAKETDWRIASSPASARALTTALDLRSGQHA